MLDYDAPYDSYTERSQIEEEAAEAARQEWADEKNYGIPRRRILQPRTINHPPTDHPQEK